jgi:hypothetical protein
VMFRIAERRHRAGGPNASRGRARTWPLISSLQTPSVESPAMRAAAAIAPQTSARRRSGRPPTSSSGSFGLCAAEPERGDTQPHYNGGILKEVSGGARVSRGIRFLPPLYSRRMNANAGWHFPVEAAIGMAFPLDGHGRRDSSIPGRGALPLLNPM